VRLAPGARLGRFTVLGLIGRGGMGEVHLAEERPDGGPARRVALKVIGGGAALAPDAGRRFERERELLARVEHANVVRALGPLEADPATGLAFFPMELVLGRSLADLVAEHGRFPVAEAVRVLVEAAAALEAAHARGVVHRDVKPSNLLVDRDGRVRLTDFGLARALDHSRLTASGRTLGTPAYMAPEQAAGAQAGPAADLYALGAVAYELLTSRPPFQAESPVALLKLHVDARPRPPRELRPEVPEALDALVVRLLEKDPAARGASAAAVRADLEALLTAHSADTSGFAAEVGASVERETRSLAALAAAPAPVSLSPRIGGRRATILAGALIVALGGAVAWVALSPGPAASGPAVEPARRAVLTLKDGRTVEGTIVRLEDEAVVLRAADGAERRVPRASLRAIEYDR